MGDLELNYVIDKLRVARKPRHVFINSNKFDSFIKTSVLWGSLGLWKKKERDDDTILVELTSDLQLLLKYIYDNNHKGQDND